MITPRQTRLVRVADLHDFRRVIVELASGFAPDPADAAVIVPTRGAANQLRRALRASVAGDVALVTRDQLYDLLHGRLANAPPRLTAFERDAIAQAAADDAAQSMEALPFRIRPGLVAELLRFYDSLRRQSQQLNRFEALIVEALGGGDGFDRGADRLLQQTQFLVAAFHAYERRARASGACDEHMLRMQLVSEPAPAPLRHLVVSVVDWIAEPTGLFVADFDLLSRIPGLETIDLVCTESLLASGFHERIHGWWPGLEEVNTGTLVPAREPIRPRLIVPVSPEGDRLWFTWRDREDELVAIADRLKRESSEPHALERVAVVFKRPLPYLYLAPDTLGSARIDYQVNDALPLAAEPLVATVDLVLDAVAANFTRDSLIALLGSPFLRGSVAPNVASLAALSELNRLLSDNRYLGDLGRLETLAADVEPSPAPQGNPKPFVQDGFLPFDEAESTPAEDVSIRSMLARAIDLARGLSAMLQPAPASQQVGHLLTFLETHWSTVDQTDRDLRVRDAMTRVLRALQAAHAAHHDPAWTVDELSAAVRRWIGEETFPIERGPAGIHLIDDQAARYGDFDDMTIVGLVENEWPDKPRRNIFYPPNLLKSLGWPSEKDRHAAAEVRFLDLVASASSRVEVSTFTLEDEALVTRSLLLDELHRARLSTVARAQTGEFDLPLDQSADWTLLRRGRSPVDAPMFHGAAGPRAERAWSVSALEVYIACPFKFFAQHVLKLEEEPDDEEVMDPRRQGQLVHEVFEVFFKEWQAAGHRGVTAADLGTARTLFTSVVDRILERLPQSEAALERTRLLGSSAAAGLGEAVFRMEAERPVPVVERLLEHSLSGRFTFTTTDGPREIDLRGKADRVDLLADDTFRVIDYKLGWPPDRNRALQLPIYGLCAEQRLNGYRGRRWTLGEAVYLAFKGPKRVTPLFTTPAAREEILVNAQQRLVDIIDAIGRGEFPVTPDDVFRCETCAFASVCRKDYVGDV